LDKKMKSTDKLVILVADDSDINQILIKFILSKLGHTVYVASNGLECIEMFRKKNFDLILMDLQMPIMCGYEATNNIRNIENSENLKRTPIIAVTANADIEKCEDVDMDGLIEKPFNIEKFNNILKKLNHELD